jgi:hypothetical protein
MTSPRQERLGHQITSDKSEYIRRTIRFKTSRTYLQTLFPTLAFSFATPGTVAEATFRVESVDKLNWLGGGGYNSFGLWIHGVQYTKQDGSKIYGAYLPVIFESLSDSIMADREELGMPKLFCDIEVHNRNRSTRVVCSWRGATFATLEWENLTEGSSELNAEPRDNQPAVDPRFPPPPSEKGLLIYRYIPAVGKRGVADAEYPVFIPNKGSSVESRVMRTFKAKSAKVNISAGDWDALPTIHHIADALSEVPIYSVVEAKIEHGLGVDNFGQPEKIEDVTRSIGPNL